MAMSVHRGSLSDHRLAPRYSPGQEPGPRSRRHGRVHVQRRGRGLAVVAEGRWRQGALDLHGSPGRRLWRILRTHREGFAVVSAAIVSVLGQMRLQLPLAAEAIEPTIELSIKDIITAVSIALTVVMLAFSLSKGLRKSRLRPVFDVVRVLIQVGAAVAVPIITAVVTPPLLMVGAVLIGVAVGVAQGMFVNVEVENDHVFASRSIIGFVIWGAGLLMMQGAGLANRTGLVEIGQAVTWLSIGISVGLILGRHTSVDRALKVAQAGAVAAVLLVGGVAVVVGGEVPVAEAQGCPPGYEQGYFDEDIQAQKPTSDPRQCSKWVNGRQATYTVYREGCNLNAEWTDLSGQSPSDRIYGRHQGLGFVLYANMIVRISTFPRSNDFDLEPAAEVYANWFGPSCAAAPEPTRAAPTSTPVPPPVDQGSTGNSGGGTSGGGSSGGGTSGGGSSGGGTSGGGSTGGGTSGGGSTGGGTSGGGSTGGGTTGDGSTNGGSSGGTTPAAPAPPTSGASATQEIEDEGGALFPTAVPEAPVTELEPTPAASQGQNAAGDDSNGTSAASTPDPAAEPTAIADDGTSETAAGQTGTGATAIPGSDGDGTDAGQDGESPTDPENPEAGATAPVVDSEDVSEDEALAAAVGGLVAAAAAGVITAAEAAAGIREALDRSGRGHVDEQELLDDVLAANDMELPGHEAGAEATTDDTDDPANQERGPNGADISRAQQIAKGEDPQIDQDWRAARERGQALVDELESVRQQIEGASDAERGPTVGTSSPTCCGHQRGLLGSFNNETSGQIATRRVLRPDTAGTDLQRRRRKKRSTA
ncbi:hypothetical protein GQR58_030467 [Nymphon striatum]|nr:hypothetical protein GQR58_030467 [Nymphon striatum]